MRLIFGLSKIEGSYAGHCWIIRDGEIYAESSDPSGTFADVYALPRVLSPGTGAPAAIRFNRFVPRRHLDRSGRFSPPSSADSRPWRRRLGAPQEHWRVDVRGSPQTAFCAPPRGRAGSSTSRKVAERTGTSAMSARGEGRGRNRDRAGRQRDRPRSSSTTPRRTSSGPLEAALHALSPYEMLRARGSISCTAVRLRRAENVCFITGGSGAGKSTTTAALAGLGLRMLGDDTVRRLQRRRHPHPAVSGRAPTSSESVALLGLRDCARTRLPGTEKWRSPHGSWAAVAERSSPASLLVFPSFQAASRHCGKSRRRSLARAHAHGAPHGRSHRSRPPRRARPSRRVGDELPVRAGLEP